MPNPLTIQTAFFASLLVRGLDPDQAGKRAGVLPQRRKPLALELGWPALSVVAERVEAASSALRIADGNTYSRDPSVQHRAELVLAGMRYVVEQERDGKVGKPARGAA